MTPKHFSGRGRQYRGKSGKAGVYNAPQSVFWFCKGSARSPHEPLDFPSAIFSQSSLCSQQQAGNFFTISNHFHALEIATFAFKPYTYVPSAPRSKSATPRRKSAWKQSSILDEPQRIKASSTSLRTPRPAVVGADDTRGN